jgi:hypothetical protein
LRQRARYFSKHACFSPGHARFFPSARTHP